MLKYIIRNVLGIVGAIIIFYMLYIFYSGAMIYEKIQGSWICIDNYDEYTFTEKGYINGEDFGKYKIRGNKLFLDTNVEYLISIRRTYMLIDGIIYFKK